MCSPLRTLQLGAHWFPERPGGLDKVFLRLLEHLPDEGVEVRGLVAADGAGGDVRPFAPASASLPRRALGLRASVRSVLREERPDLVASHFALYTAPALDLVRERPLVIHFHGPWAAESAAEGANRASLAAKRAVERAVYRRAATFIVLSEAFRSLLVRDYGADPRTVRIVPGGVDQDLFDVATTRDEARHRLGWPTDRPVVLTVRRLVRRMGLEGLLEAIQSVRQLVPDVLLLIAGRGPITGELLARVEALELSEHVRLLGFVPDCDLPSAYRAADVTVVPTVALEGFGLVAAESLAAGTPVLVTPVGGLPEVVRDLDPGLVVPTASPGDVGGRLADALLGHLNLPSQDACRQFARKHYAWPTVAREVSAVYGEVI